MRTKITIVFETYGSGTVHQHDDWGRDLLERIAFALRLPEPTGDNQYPLVTFDIISTENLEQEP
jgi:hypothetical protein